AYPTIHQHGSFEENWEQMNAMNFVFVPNGLTTEVLETYFDQCYRTFYSRRDVLRGLAMMMLREPRFAGRLASNAVLYLRNKSGAARNFFRRDVPAELKQSA